MAQLELDDKGIWAKKIIVGESAREVVFQLLPGQRPEPS
jgi:hypothetical protein